MLGAMKQMQFDSAQYTVQTFTSDGSWTAPATIVSPVNILIAAGGGGGGSGTYNQANFSLGGGGGAGGVIVATLSNIIAGTTYTITVGTGGTGVTWSGTTLLNPTTGANSSITGTGISNLLARGGGYGGNPNDDAGDVGGSGGGGWTASTGTTTAGSAGTAGQGFSGGSASIGGTSSTVEYSAGGGGGANGAGFTFNSTDNWDVPTATLRNGGVPYYSTITGANVAYSEGGGGAGNPSSATATLLGISAGLHGGYAPSAKGSGGAGGTGPAQSQIVSATDGQPGIVIIKYLSY
jgi:hypothetical protein